ncbi:MAG: MmcQ/YjbR family DNA-binding protein [Bacteroidales bacterium]|nr:MmcQ/YjbR family DNA-binding protein [Bacteroidales bacterium]
MNIEEVREYCLTKPGATEDMPFGEGYVTLRVGGKIFCCLVLDRGPLAQLKWSPDEFDEIIVKCLWVTQAWHWHKRHMIQFDCSDPTVDDAVASSLIDRAYNYVLSRLPKRIKSEITEPKSRK